MLACQLEGGQLDVGPRDFHVGADVLRRAAQPLIEALAGGRIDIAHAKVDEPLGGLVQNQAI